MPFVTCPSCGKESIAPRELAGLQWNCPKCNMAMIVEEDGPGSAVHEYDPAMSRRRAREKHAKRQLFWKLGSVALLIAVTLGVWVAKQSQTGGGIPTIIGTRTIGDLVQHFERSGLKGKYSPKAAVIIGAKE